MNGLPTPPRLAVGEVLSEAWGLYTRNSGPLIAMAAIVFGFLSLVNAVVDSLGFGRTVFVAVAIGVTIVGIVWLQGALVAVTEQLRTRGGSVRIGETFQRVEPRLWTLLGAGVVMAIAFVPFLVLASFWLPLMLAVAALATYWSLVMPAVVLEGLGVRAALVRSMRLISGNFLRAFAVVVLTVLLATIVSFVIIALLQPLPAFFDFYVAGVVANSVTIPFVALAWTVMYFHLRR